MVKPSSWALWSARRWWDEVGPGAAGRDARRLSARITRNIVEEITASEVSIDRALTESVRLRLRQVDVATESLPGIETLVARRIERAYRRCGVDPRPIEISLSPLGDGDAEVTATVRTWPDWVRPVDATLGTDGPGLALVLDGLVLGRDGEDLDGALAHPKVSRRHAQITSRRGRWMIRDLGSRHGTEVDGEPVQHQPVVLPQNCTISLGPVDIRFSEALSR